MKKVNNRLVVTLVSCAIVTILALLMNYLILVPRTIHSGGTWWYAVFWLVIAGIIALIISKVREPDEPAIESRIAFCMAGILLIILIIINFTSSILMNTEAYVNLVTIEEGDFETDIIEADSDDIISVDVLTAQRLGDRTISTLSNSTLFNVDDEYNLVEINGTWYRISPLNYGGWFKYQKAKDSGIPGYVLVDAKTSEATLVTLEEGMKYSPSAYFGYDLSRHLRNQFPSLLFGKSFFEVDDEGTPYWITGVYTTKIGVTGGKVEETAVITNAVTGESILYKIEDLPEWVDHVSSVSYLMNLVQRHYSYINGYWNFSHNGVYRTSYYYKDSSSKKEEENNYTPFEGYNSVIGKDGELYFYTGLTPANAAESNIGFLLISPKTGKVTYYEAAGAEESSAQAAAEGLVQNLGYSASFPTILNVDGIETYFMVLKDDAGLVQRYALCNVANYTKVVQAESIDEAISLYRTKMGIAETQANTTEEDETSEVESQTVTGTIVTMTEAVIDGNTYYYYVIQINGETDENVYVSSIKNSLKQPIICATFEGDSSSVTVTLEYTDSEEANVKTVTKVVIEDNIE